MDIYSAFIVGSYFILSCVLGLKFDTNISQVSLHLMKFDPSPPRGNSIRGSQFPTFRSCSKFGIHTIEPRKLDYGLDKHWTIWTLNWIMDFIGLMGLPVWVCCRNPI